MEDKIFCDERLCILSSLVDGENGVDPRQDRIGYPCPESHKPLPSASLLAVTVAHLSAEGLDIS